jgi:hypothetical protein
MKQATTAQQLHFLRQGYFVPASEVEKLSIVSQVFFSIVSPVLRCLKIKPRNGQ